MLNPRIKLCDVLVDELNSPRPCSACMNFTLQQLRAFVMVVSAGSVTRAAEELHLTQPAVSMQLRGFEDGFERPLFERVGRRMDLTPFGEEVLEHAKSILAEAHSIHRKRSEQPGECTGSLSIASVSTGKYVLPRFLAAFAADHPHVAIQLEVTNRSRVIELLEDNAIDYALVSLPPERMEVESIPLVPNELHIVAPPGWRIPSPESPAFEAWLNESPLIFRETGSGTRRAFERLLASRGVDLSPVWELGTNEAVKQAVMAGMGVSLMSVAGFAPEKRLGLIASTPVHGDWETAWQLVRRKGKPLTQLRERFESHLASKREAIVTEHFPWAVQCRPISR